LYSFKNIFWESKSLIAHNIVELRKLILGEESEFNSNTSWRFVDKEYNFPQANNPWFEVFPEEYDIVGLENNMNVDFIGVKVGDVSGNASANAMNKIEVRSSDDPLKLISEIKEINENLIAIEVSSTNFEQVAGFQTTLNFDAKKLEFLEINSENLKISSDNIATYAVHRGHITMSWSDANGVSLEDNKEVFTMMFKVKEQGDHVLSIGSELISTEAYFDGNVSGSITLDTKEISGFALNQNVPNPWKDQTTISFEIEKPGNVNMRIIDMSGKTLISRNGQYPRGKNNLYLDRSSLPQAGVYLIELKYESRSHIKRMIVLD